MKTIATNSSGATITQIMEGTGKSNAQVKRYLQTLKALELIEYIGTLKYGRYYLTEIIKAKLKLLHDNLHDKK